MTLLRALSALAALLPLVLVPTVADASPELARSKNCVACHHPERKMIGPSMKAIAERYANDEAAVAGLREKVVKGGGGVWGALPMPPQPQVSPEEAATLVQWIMTQK